MKTSKSFCIVLLAVLTATSAFASNVSSVDLGVMLGASRNFALSPSRGYLVDGPSLALESSFNMEPCSVVLSESITTNPDITVFDTTLTLRKTTPLNDSFSFLMESGVAARLVSDSSADAAILCRSGIKCSVSRNMDLSIFAGVRLLSSGAIGVDASVGGSYRFD